MVEAKPCESDAAGIGVSWPAHSTLDEIIRLRICDACGVGKDPSMLWRRSTWVVVAGFTVRLPVL
jgi:hypothetical protein